MHSKIIACCLLASLVALPLHEARAEGSDSNQRAEMAREAQVRAEAARRRELATQLLRSTPAPPTPAPAKFDGTPAGWARHCGHAELAGLIERWGGERAIG